MIKFVYDLKNKYGYIPNLVKDTTLKPKSKEWYDLALKFPFSQENRLIKYLRLDVVPHKETLVDELDDDEVGHYMVNINFFDPVIDYFELMEPSSYKRLKERKLVFVFYYSEGDWIDEHIAPRLEYLTDKHDIDPNFVKFVCANALAPDYGDNYIYFPDDELYYRYLHIHKQDYVMKVNLNKRDKKFTFLNRIDKDWRRVFAASMWQHGMQNLGYFSYCDKKYTTDYAENETRDNIFEWETYWNDLVRLVAQFELYTPIFCDEFSDAERNDHSIIHKPFFENAYWQFIPETHFTNDTIFLTEKTFKCILNMQPFIIIGNPGSLSLLEELGYKTFDEYIYEDYDSVVDNEKRLHRCFTECYQVTNYTHESHLKVMYNLKDTLEYNQRVFLASKKYRLNTLIDNIKV